MTERDEQNRRIAEWLEPLSSLPNDDDSEEMQAYESVAWIASFRLSQVTCMGNNIVDESGIGGEDAL